MGKQWLTLKMNHQDPETHGWEALPRERADVAGRAPSHTGKAGVSSGACAINRGLFVFLFTQTAFFFSFKWVTLVWFIHFSKC